MPNPPNVDCTVIIVNWNGSGLLPQCLESVRAGSNQLGIETIVVDNKSKDDSVRIVRTQFPEVHVIEPGENLGFGRANNLALRRARGEFIFILNPDAMVEPNTISAAITFLKGNPDVACIGCLVQDEDGSVQPLGVQRDPTPFLEFIKMFSTGKGVFAGILPTKDPTISGPVLKLYGSNMVIRADVFRRLGGFDDRFFMYCEDVDLCRRIRDQGLKLHYLTDTKVQHFQGSCTKSAPKGFSVLMQCDALEKYFSKYNGVFGALLFRLLLFVGATLRVLLSTVAYLGCFVTGRKDERSKWQAKLFRNWMMLRWSAFTKRAFIPS